MAASPPAYSETTAVSNGAREANPPRDESHSEEDIPLFDSDKQSTTSIQVKKGRRTSGFATCLRWWLPELLASVASISTLLAMILVLQHYNNKTLSDLNLPSYLTLNGLAAVLSTINRALLMAPVGSALMQELWLHFAARSVEPRHSAQLRDMDVFDAASRGFWGSMVFLYHVGSYAVLRRRRKVIGTLCALITIVSLGFGTFTQQLITYTELKPSNISRPGNLPHAEVWDRSVKTYLTDATPDNPSPGGGSTAPSEITAALYSGSLGRGSVAPISGNCPSGNCTWPITPSLAVCGSCTNVDFSIGDSYMLGQRVEELPLRNYTLPSGYQVPLYDFEKEPVGRCLTCDVGYVFQVVNDTGTIYNDALVPYVAHFSLLGASAGFNDLPNLSKNVKASECALWMCVQAYNTTVTASQSIQHIVSTSNHTKKVYDTAWHNFTDSQELQEWLDTPERHRTKRQLLSKKRPTRQILVPSDINSRNATFNVTTDAFEGMENYLSRALLGYVTMTQTTQHFSNDLIFGAWDGSRDAEKWINDIATSLTNVIRAAGNTNATVYDGTSYELGVTIRWNWIALPVVLVLGSIVVLVCVMVKTERSEVYPWKGSPLMFLMFELEGDVRERALGMELELNGIQNAVGRSRVRLVEEGGKAWKFKAM